MVLFISDLPTICNFENRVKVKSYIRKGKVVKSFDRKGKLKKLAVNTGLGVATVLGVSAAAYAGLKFRYVNNLNRFAKNLQVTEKVAPTSKKYLSFAIGGFGVNGKPTTAPQNQSNIIAGVLKAMNKDQEVIALAHNLEVPTLPSNPREHGRALLSLLFQPIRQGKNSESEKLIQQIYNHAQANPGKTINMATFSAGGNMGRDVQYVLNKKGIKTKLVTTGSTDFRFVAPSKNNLEINSKHDLTNILRSSNSKMVDEVTEHRPDKYYRNKDVKEQVKKYLYTDS